MLSCPVWSNLDVSWSAIPLEQIDIATALLSSHCQYLFPNELPNEVLLSVLRSRLYLRRESWKVGKKKIRDREIAKINSDQPPNLGLLQLNEREQHEEQPSPQNPLSSLIITWKIPNSANKPADAKPDQNVDLANKTLPNHSQQVAESSAMPLFSVYAPSNLTPSNSNISGDSETILDTTADADTIIVNLEGRKGTASAPTLTKTSPQKRRQACDGCDEPKVSTLEGVVLMRLES